MSAGPKGDFAFTRHYNNVPAKITPTAVDPYYGPMGSQWGHSFSWLLTEYGSNSDVRLITPELKALDFTRSGSVYTGSGDALAYSLTKSVSATWTLVHRHSGAELSFDSSMRLTQIRDREGNTESLTWGPPTAGVTTTSVTTGITATSGLSYSVTYTAVDPHLPLEQQTRFYVGGITENSTGRAIYYSYIASELLFEAYDSALNNATHRLTYGYSSAGGDPGSGWILSSVTNRKGNVVFDQLYTTGRRVASQLENATASVTYTYDDANSKMTKTSSTGQVATAYYNTAGRITDLTDMSGGHFQYGYDTHNNLTSYTDASGQAYAVAYNSADRITSITRPGGLVTSHTYDANQDRETTTDPGGHTTEWERDANGNITAQIDALGQREEWTYNARGQVVTHTNKRGHTTTNTYNATGQLITVSNPLSQVTTYEYDGRWRVTASVADGARTTYAYDLASRVTRITNPLGAYRTFSYDADSNLLSTSNWRGNLTEYNYLQSGAPYDKPQFITTPIRTHNPTYDGKGRLLTDGGTPLRYFSYDSVGRHIRTTETGSGTEYVTYTADSLVATRTDKMGRLTSHSYDSVGRLVRTTLPDGTTERIEYNNCGLVSATVAPGGGRTEYGYDALHRTTNVTDTMGRVTTYGYDPTGNVTQVVRPGSETWSYTYDALGRKLTETDPAGGVTTWAYSCACGKPTSMTNARGKTWTFEYDALGRKTAETDPLNNRWEWTYDADGNVLTEEDPTGAVITRTYDGAGRLTGVTYPVTAMNVTVTYPSGQERPSAIEDGSTKQVFGYDDAWRVTSIQNQMQGMFGWQTHATMYYSYNANGERTRVGTTSSGDGVSYTRDSRGRVSVLSEEFMGGFPPLPQTFSTTLTYNADNQPLTITRPNGVTTTITYTAANQVGSIRHHTVGSTLEHFTYARDSRGNITTKGALAGSTTYGYDSANRLIATTGPVETERFTYDAAGNMTTRFSSITGTVTHTYNDADRLTSSTDNTTYTYNARGDLTQTVNGATTWDYVYDGARRMSEVKKNGATQVTYGYYPSSPLMRWRQLPGQLKTYYVLDGGNVFEDHEEVSGQPNTTAKLRYTALDGLDRLQARRDLVGGSLAHFLGDHLGSVRLLTDGSGSTLNSYTYSSYGLLLSATESVTNRFGFTQREGDPAAELYFYRNRWYSPAIARFTQRDPKGFDEDSFNLYEYVSGNPVLFTDPSGLEKEFLDRYLDHLDKYTINVGPCAAALAGGLWPKSLVWRTGGRRALLGSTNPLTSVPRAIGVPGAGSAAMRGGAAAIGVVTVGAGFYNIGVAVGGIYWAW